MNPAADDDAVSWPPPPTRMPHTATAPVLKLYGTTPVVDRASLVQELDTRLDTPAPFVPTRSQPCEHMRERGVYLASFLDPYGNPIVQAIGADHRLRGWLPWHHGEELRDVIDRLTVILERYEARQSPRITI
jgi:hypothetical protein